MKNGSPDNQILFEVLNDKKKKKKKRKHCIHFIELTTHTNPQTHTLHYTKSFQHTPNFITTHVTPANVALYI